MAEPPTAAPAPSAAPVPTAAPEPAPDRVEARADEADASLVRSVRWRLVAWSGGTTLVILLALAVALYVSMSSSLAAAGVGQLENRAGDLQAFVEGRRPEPPDRPPTGYGFGGSNAGTFAMLVAPDGTVFGPREFQLPKGLPDGDGLQAAVSGGRDVRLRTVDDVPLRILTVSAANPQGTYLVQVVQDRTTEARTLQSLVVVLLIGGALVLLVSFGFGAIYARRALVPIRESLAGQRASLRRQREFAADASHELRTPLTVIRSSVDHLRKHATRPVGEVGDALVDIDAEVDHVTSLVEDLLLLARSDSGAITLEHVPLHLDDIAADATASLAQPAAAAGVRLEVDPAPTAAVGDPARLRQLVTILVDNAIRHSPRGGAVRVLVRPEAGAATVAVEDAGPGVAPEDRARVFDRFWRAPGAPAGGTGLGLAIAKWIAEHHDGTISIASSDAGGARFEVRIPTPPTRPAPEAAS